MEKMTILAGSVERAGSFVPTIIVNGDGRYFASESSLHAFHSLTRATKTEDFRGFPN